jgi:hypothetical protein
MKLNAGGVSVDGVVLFMKSAEKRHKNSPNPVNLIVYNKLETCFAADGDLTLFLKPGHQQNRIARVAEQFVRLL